MWKTMELTSFYKVANVLIKSWSNKRALFIKKPWFLQIIETINFITSKQSVLALSTTVFTGGGRVEQIEVKFILYLDFILLAVIIFENIRPIIFY